MATTPFPFGVRPLELGKQVVGDSPGLRTRKSEIYVVASGYGDGEELHSRMSEARSAGAPATPDEGLMRRLNSDAASAGTGSDLMLSAHSGTNSPSSSAAGGRGASPHPPDPRVLLTAAEAQRAPLAHMLCSSSAGTPSSRDNDESQHQYDGQAPGNASAAMAPSPFSRFAQQRQQGAAALRADSEPPAAETDEEQQQQQQQQRGASASARAASGPSASGAAPAPPPASAAAAVMGHSSAQMAELVSAWREDLREKMLLKQQLSAGEVALQEALQEARRQNQAMQERLMQQVEVAKLRMRIAEEGEAAATSKLKNSQLRVAELSTALTKAKRDVAALTQDNARLARELSAAQATLTRLASAGGHVLPPGGASGNHAPLAPHPSAGHPAPDGGTGGSSAAAAPPGAAPPPAPPPAVRGTHGVAATITFFNSVFSAVAARTPANSLQPVDQAELLEAEAEYLVGRDHAAEAVGPASAPGGPAAGAEQPLAARSVGGGAASSNGALLDEGSAGLVVSAGGALLAMTRSASAGGAALSPRAPAAAGYGAMSPSAAAAAASAALTSSSPAAAGPKKGKVASLTRKLRRASSEGGAAAASMFRRASSEGTAAAAAMVAAVSRGLGAAGGRKPTTASAAQAPGSVPLHQLRGPQCEAVVAALRAPSAPPPHSSAPSEELASEAGSCAGGSEAAAAAASSSSAGGGGAAAAAAAASSSAATSSPASARQGGAPAPPADKDSRRRTLGSKLTAFSRSIGHSLSGGGGGGGGGGEAGEGEGPAASCAASSAASDCASPTSRMAQSAEQAQRLMAAAKTKGLHVLKCLRPSMPAALVASPACSSAELQQHYYQRAPQPGVLGNRH